eukprot:scaffold248_cov111-Cylindrotheca_fusiformis.AAC.10
MKRRNKRKRGIEKVDPNRFVFTRDTNYADIPRGLTHLRADSSVREIPSKAFQNRHNLVQVQLPDTLSRIGESAFASCFRLKNIRFAQNPAFVATSSESPNLEDGLIVFPERAELQIDKCAFSYCRGLRKVIVCSVSTKLGEAAFSNCRSLRAVELPQGLQVIEAWLFCRCLVLTSAKIPSSVIKICHHAFFLCRCLTSFDLPYGLLEIGACCFRGCSSIEALQIPPTVSSIGKSAFQNCIKLKQVTLPTSLERITQLLFYGCQKLEYIDIPATVKIIENVAFWGCSSLSHIRIPPNVDSLEKLAFSRCINLISIELPEGFLFDIGPTKFESLVNVAVPALDGAVIPTPDFLQHSKLGNVVDGHHDLVRKLKHRFDNSPLNKLCYYQSYYSSRDAMVQLHSLMDENPLAATQVDEFGMTPLHILSLSQTPNLSMLLAVMNGGHPDHIIRGRDSFGSTPMDYLCLNKIPSSTQVIQSLLQATIVKRVDRLGLDRWKLVVLQAVDQVSTVDWLSRRRAIGMAYFQLANYERKEILSLMELYLWNLRIQEVGPMDQSAGRRKGCRINSGASVVIPHVLRFLGKLDMEDYFVSDQ